MIIDQVIIIYIMFLKNQNKKKHFFMFSHTIEEKRAKFLTFRF